MLNAYGGMPPPPQYGLSISTKKKNIADNNVIKLNSETKIENVNYYSFFLIKNYFYYLNKSNF